MRADVLVWLAHAVVTWILARSVASLAVSAGAQSLWALAAATGVTVLVATLLTGWLTRTHKAGLARLLLRLLPVPVLGAGWTGVTVVAHGGDVSQVLVAGCSWVVGAALAVTWFRATRRTRSRREGPFLQFAAGDR